MRREEANMTDKPIRIQRRRTKGYKLPPNTVSICRPGPWGNPFKIGHYYFRGDTDPHARLPFTWMESYAPDPQFTLIRDARQAVEWFKWYISISPSLRQRIREELRNKNVACVCRLDSACHGDVLLEIANEEPP